MTVHSATSVVWRGFLLVSAVTIGVGARVIQNPQPMPGYSAAGAAAQRGIESEAVAVPSPTDAAEHARALSREPHVAGTPAQARTRDYVIERMRAWGLETEVRAYEVWMPHPTSVRVWRVAPDPRELSLAEGPVAGDSTTMLPEIPPINGYGGTGDATAE